MSPSGNEGIHEHSACEGNGDVGEFTVANTISACSPPIIRSQKTLKVVPIVGYKGIETGSCPGVTLVIIGLLTRIAGYNVVSASQ
jgi:hypothetical protein